MATDYLVEFLYNNKLYKLADTWAREQLMLKADMGVLSKVALSNNYNDLLDVPSINGVLLKGAQTSESLGIKGSMSSVEPLLISKPQDFTITLDISSMPYVTVSGFSIITNNEELFVPLYSTEGISRISKVKTDNAYYLKLDIAPDLHASEWSACTIYLCDNTRKAVYINNDDPLVHADYYVDDAGNFYINDNDADNNPYVDDTGLHMRNDTATTLSVSNSELEIYVTKNQ